MDQYTGGSEHAVGHLLYARFITKFLKKIGYVTFDEPFLNLLNQGMVNMGGSKMSKSKGNVIDPLDTINKYSADTLRTYLLFIAAPTTSFEWSDKDIRGVHKFLKKVTLSYKLGENREMRSFTDTLSNKKIVEITKHYDNSEFNKVIISLMDFYSVIEKYPSKYSLNIFLKMLSPIAPHICEEIWSKWGNKTMLVRSNWPEYNKSKINELAYKKGLGIESLIDDVRNILKIISTKPKTLFVYVIPSELKIYNSSKEIISSRLKLDVEVFASNDKNKIDPDNKSKKAKPGKPGIYLK